MVHTVRPRSVKGRLHPASRRQCPLQICAARFSSNVVQSRICKNPPGIPPRSRNKCKHKPNNCLHPLPLGRSLVHSHGPVRSVLTVMMGLSVHATVQCGVLALRRQHPLCAVMVDASQTRCGICIWSPQSLLSCSDPPSPITRYHVRLTSDLESSSNTRRCAVHSTARIPRRCSPPGIQGMFSTNEHRSNRSR